MCTWGRFEILWQIIPNFNPSKDQHLRLCPLYAVDFRDYFLPNGEIEAEGEIPAGLHLPHPNFGRPVPFHPIYGELGTLDESDDFTGMAF